MAVENVNSGAGKGFITHPGRVVWAWRRSLLPPDVRKQNGGKKTVYRSERKTAGRAGLGNCSPRAGFEAALIPASIHKGFMGAGVLSGTKLCIFKNPTRRGCPDGHTHLTGRVYYFIHVTCP